MAQHASDTQFHNVHPALFAMVIVFLAGILLTAVNTVCLLAFTLRGTSAQAVSALIEIGLGIIIAVLYRRKTGVRLGFSSKGLLTGLLYALPVIALAAMSLTSDVSQWVDAGYPPDAGLIGLGALVALSAGLYEEITYRAMIVGGVSQATGGEGSGRASPFSRRPRCSAPRISSTCFWGCRGRTSRSLR